MAVTAAPTRTLSAVGNAHERLVRSAARLAGVAGVLSVLATAPLIADQISRVPWWWTGIVGTTVLGSATVIVVASYRSPIATIRRTVTVYAASYLAGELSWLLLGTDGSAHLKDGSWLATFPGIVCFATAAVWRPVPIFGYLIMAVTLAEMIQRETRTDYGDSTFVLECVSRVAYCTLFALACIGAMRSGRILDETAELARSQAGGAAAAEARAAERRRFDALTHDGVMATLLGASRSANNPALAVQAEQTLSQLDLLRSGRSQSAEFDATTLRAQMLAAVADDVPVRFVHTADASDLVVPGEVGRALLGAVTEAIRNARRHAGADAACAVYTDIGTDQVRIDIVDDGHGFDPRRVPPHRLGLRVSIEGQFGELPGAWTRVDSAPGSGTRITLGWRRSG